MVTQVTMFCDTPNERLNLKALELRTWEIYSIKAIYL